MIPTPTPITANSYWKMQNGEKAYVGYWWEERKVWVGHSCFSTPTMWDEVGGSSPNHCCLIEPWREPVKVSAWVNVYKDQDYRIYKSQQKADACAYSDRIACIYVSGEEGRGP